MDNVIRTYEFYASTGKLLGKILGVSEEDAINDYMIFYGEPWGYIVTSVDTSWVD